MLKKLFLYYLHLFTLVQIFFFTFIYLHPIYFLFYVYYDYFRAPTFFLSHHQLTYSNTLYLALTYRQPAWKSWNECLNKESTRNKERKRHFSLIIIILCVCVFILCHLFSFLSILFVPEVLVRIIYMSTFMK